MVADIKTQGLTYDLQTTLPEAPGCRVEIALYDPLLPSDQVAFERELARAVKWVSIPVTINGKLVSHDPATAKWDHETPEAYFKLRESGVMAVFNLGVHVRDLSSYHLGMGGEIVSKAALEVNFARNDIQSTCPQWKKIKKTLAVQAGTHIREKKAPLTDTERQYLVSQFLANDVADADFRQAKVLTDVQGVSWSLSRWKQHMQRHDLRAITVAPLHDRAGDVIHDQQQAFVFAPVTLERFDVPDLDGLLALLAERRYIAPDAFEVRDFAAVAATLDTNRRIVPDTSARPTEKFLLDVLSTVQDRMLREYAYHAGDDDALPRRKLLLGESETARAWTDGRSYIAIHRNELSDANMTVERWTTLGLLLAHEYAHQDSDEVTHIHGEDFHAGYVRIVEAGLPAFLREATNVYPVMLTAAGKRWGKEVLRQADRAMKIAAALPGATTAAEALAPKPVRVTSAPAPTAPAAPVAPRDTTALAPVSPLATPRRVTAHVPPGHATNTGQREISFPAPSPVGT